MHFAHLHNISLLCIVGVDRRVYCIFPVMSSDGGGQQPTTFKPCHWCRVL